MNPLDNDGIKKLIGVTPVDITDKKVKDNSIEDQIKNIIKLSDQQSEARKKETTSPTIIERSSPMMKTENKKIPEKQITKESDISKNSSPVSPVMITGQLPEKKENTSPVSPEMITGQLPEKKENSSPVSTEKTPPNFLKNIIELLKPSKVEASFDKNTMYKVIDGVPYKSLEEYKKNPIRCFFETCDLTWQTTPWQNR